MFRNKINFLHFFLEFVNMSIIENDITLKPKIVYKPKEHRENQLVHFRKFVESKYKIEIKDYWELHEWSCKNYPEFWDSVFIFFDVLYSQPYTQVFDRRNGFLNAKWFEGLRFNYAANIIKYRDSHTALIATDDDDNTQFVTYEELYHEVKVYIRALKDAGIQKGDIVSCYMSNKIEPVFAFLAAAAIGAIWSGSLPLLGSKGTIARFEQINPKIMFISGNFFFGGTEIRMDHKSLVQNLPCLEKVVYIPSKMERNEEDISRIPKCVLISKFLEESRRALADDKTDIEFEQVAFDYPLCISFTSGTTGEPKSLIHSQGSFLATLKSYGLSQDCTREDVLFNFSAVGWVPWHNSVNCLYLGLTLIMYEGDVFINSCTRFWDMVDKFGITSSYIWNCTVENMERKGYVPTPKHSLKTLKQLFPMGSPVKPHSFNFLTEQVKKNLFCSPDYGSTEVFGPISGVDSNLPVYRGEMQAFALGMDVRILDENDQPVIGKRGELVIANPYPATPVAILNDKDNELMKELYLSQHPGYWNVGDDAWLNSVTKGFIVYGRNDDVMNPNGARFSCGELYCALEGFPGIMDSVCVSQFHSNMDERMVLFVKMDFGCTLTEDIENDIKTTIKHHLHYSRVPAIIRQVPDIPYNLTGKKLNGVVKNLINHRPIKNAEIVVNPSSLDFYKTVDLGKFI